MQGIAFLAPDERSLEQAGQIIKEADFSIAKCKLIETIRAVEEAEAAIAEGNSILIARGKQAYYMKRHTKAMVVEIVLTAQELGLLVMQAKKLVSKERPHIGLFGWGNVLSDTSHFDELYDIELRRYCMYREEDRVSGILAVERDGLDVVIAGEGMLRAAEAYGIPGVYLAGTGEGIYAALKEAENLLFAREKQYSNEQHLAYMMDMMHQGIMKLDKTGEVLYVNATMEKLMGVAQERLTGHSYTKYLKGMDEKRLAAVYGDKDEGFSFFYKYHGEEWFVMAEPVVTQMGNDGAALIFNTSASAQNLDAEKNKRLWQEGKMVCRTFDDIHKNMKDLRKIAEKAKLFAKSSSPILVEGVTGPEMELICEGIHSYGSRSQGPYFMINITGMDEEQQEKVLFGEHTTERTEPGMIEKAHLGTLVIGSINKLTLQNQYKLAQCIRNKILPETGSRVDTRIIAYSSKDLAVLHRDYAFRSELYFILKSLRLRIPSLKERKDDVACLLELYMKQYMKEYERYHVLTGGAKKILMEYPWSGNSIQLQSFCERMILTADKRSITEEYVRKLLEELYAGETQQEEKELQSVVEAPLGQEDPMCRLIDQTLRKYNGNRTLTAKELRMSTTTLWRKIKKYGLE